MKVTRILPLIAAGGAIASDQRPVAATQKLAQLKASRTGAAGNRARHEKPARRNFLRLLLLSLCVTACGTKHTALRHLSSPPKKYAEAASTKRISSHKAEIFDNGPAIRQKILDLINSATDYILIDSFLFVDHPETKPVLDALRRKHKEGVRIHIIADTISHLDPGSDSPFKDLGIPIVEFNPIRIHKLPAALFLLKRDHRKFWIVDGKTLFLGGANVYPTSLKPSADGGNHDIMVALESRQAVAKMLHSFVDTWNKFAKRKQRLSAADFRVRARQGGEGSLWISDQNRDAGGNGEIARMFEGLFAVAQNEIWLIQPYTFTTKDMLKQIKQLTARGVKVNLMLSEHVHSQQYHYGTLYGVKDLLEAGAKVWTVKHHEGPMHTKAILVDGRLASVGSANFNARAYHLSSEANLVFNDRKTVESVKRAIEKLKKKCRPIELEEAKKYRGAEYFSIWLLMQVLG